MDDERIIEVLLVDDHTVVREGVRQFFEKTRDIRIIGEACDVESALSVIEARDWTLVMLDIALPGESGMEGLRKIRQLRPSLPVLIFSGFSEEQYALNCMKLGAAGYLNKDCEPAEIREAVRKTAAGQRYVGDRLAARLLDATTNPIQVAPHKALTKREFEVMIRISRGQSLTRIGNDLNLSVKTISSHRARILERMNFDSNADIVKYVVTNGLDDELSHGRSEFS